MAKAEKLEYQTYHIIKGKYHGGSTRDRGLEETHFEDLFESLTEILEKRKMYPEVDQNLGDLLIMVSWGKTSLDPDWGELQGIAGASDMMSAESQDQQSSGGNMVASGGGQNAQMIPAQTSAPSSGAGAGQTLGSRNTSQKSKNMALLGLQGMLRGRGLLGHSPDEELWGALEEERYFVILNAFDYQHLLKNKELKQVWRVRYNTRATGIGFKTAYESMNHAISGVIGLQLDKLSTVRGDTKGSISMGELEVLEMTEEEKRSTSD